MLSQVNIVLLFLQREITIYEVKGFIFPYQDYSAAMMHEIPVPAGTVEWSFISHQLYGPPSKDNYADSAQLWWILNSESGSTITVYMWKSVMRTTKSLENT